MIRLFVGLDLPLATRQRLSMLAGGVPGAAWVDPAMLHLTVRFIGEVEEHVAEEIDHSLSRLIFSPFELTLAGVGHFEAKGRPTALWAGVERSAALISLREKVESALRRAGIGADGQRYSPHVTLARLKDPPTHRLRNFLLGNALFRDGPIPIAAVTLFSSHLARSGAVYVPEAAYRLAGA